MQDITPAINQNISHQFKISYFIFAFCATRIDKYYLCVFAPACLSSLKRKTLTALIVILTLTALITLLSTKILTCFCTA
jgi:hypothetical protein